MQRKCQRDLKILLREFQDSRHDSAGRYRDVSLADIESLLAREQAHKADQIVVVVHRLSGTHDHNIGNALPGQRLNPVNLIEHLGRGQISLKSVKRGRAEATTHATADLGGDADRVAVMIFHPDTLNHISIGKTKQILSRSVDCRDFDIHRRQRSQRTGLLELLAKRGGKIRHLVKICHELLMHPLKNLLCTESLLSSLSHPLFQLRKIQRFDIFLSSTPSILLLPLKTLTQLFQSDAHSVSSSFLLYTEIKNPSHGYLPGKSCT